MPIGRLRNQDITYWTMGALKSDGYTTYNTPVTVKGRWEDREVLIMEGSHSEKLSSNSRVYLDVVLPQGTYVIRGINTDLTPPTGARKVIRNVEIPSVDARVSEKVHYLD